MTNVNTFIERALLAIEDKDWSDAERLLDRALDEDYKCARAYILKFLVSKQAASVSELNCLREDIEADANIKKAVRFAEGEDKATLDAILASSKGVADKMSVSLAQNKKAAALAERLKPYTFLKSDGTVETTIPVFKDALDWSNIVSISLSDDMLVGIRADGILECCGDYAKRYFKEMFELTDIVKVDVASSYIVALDKQGKLHICGYDFEDDFDCLEVESWTDIVDFKIGTGGNGMYAITADGRVKKTGTLFFYPSSSDDRYDEAPITTWTDIQSVCVGADFALGLRKDGRVLACGNNDVGQCAVKDWTNIVQIFASFSYSVGLRADGTLVYCGSNEGLTQVADISYIKAWKDVKYFYMALDGKHAIGLKSDGTVEHYGWDANPDMWKDVVSAVIREDIGVAVTKDGRILTTAADSEAARSSLLCVYFENKIFDNVDKINEEFAKKAPAIDEKYSERRQIRKDQKKLARTFDRKNKCRCQHCGASFKGTFSLVCSSCGKPLDYELSKAAKKDVLKVRLKKIFSIAMIVALIALIIYYACVIYQVIKYEKDFEDGKIGYVPSFISTQSNE